MITENLSTLKIHNLTKEQYERELAAGRIDENALYLTPYEETDLSSYATQEYVDDIFCEIRPYLLDIDYDAVLAFDTSEIVFGTNTSSVLGQAILGQTVLA